MTLTLVAESTAAPTPYVAGWAVASATGVSEARFISASPPETHVERLGAVSIMSEQFFFEREGGCLFLVHPVWSLVGSGLDIAGLLEDLRAEAVRILEVFAVDSPEDLSDQSRAMLRFAAKLAALET